MAAKGVTYPTPRPLSGTKTAIVPVVIAPLTAAEVAAPATTVNLLSALGVG